jgi:hypothetical protein
MELPLHVPGSHMACDAGMVGLNVRSDETCASSPPEGQNAEPRYRWASLGLKALSSPLREGVTVPHPRDSTDQSDWQ